MSMQRWYEVAPLSWTPLFTRARCHPQVRRYRQPATEKLSREPESKGSNGKVDRRSDQVRNDQQEETRSDGNQLFAQAGDGGRWCRSKVHGQQ